MRMITEVTRVLGEGSSHVDKAGQSDGVRVVLDRLE